jgi:hypothetical protein
VIRKVGAIFVTPGGMVKGDVHDVDIVSYAKTWPYHYHGVPQQYFLLYIKEIEFRFNQRRRSLPDTCKYSGKNCSKCLGITDK